VYLDHERLHTADGDGTHVRSLGPLHLNISAAAWAPDGRTIAFADDRHRVWEMRADGQSAHVVAHNDEDSTNALVWQPLNGAAATVAHLARPAPTGRAAC